MIEGVEAVLLFKSIGNDDKVQDVHCALVVDIHFGRYSLVYFPFFQPSGTGSGRSVVLSMTTCSPVSEDLSNASITSST